MVPGMNRLQPARRISVLRQVREFLHRIGGLRGANKQTRRATKTVSLRAARRTLSAAPDLVLPYILRRLKTDKSTKTGAMLK
jgi:hypothetical protein